MDDATDCARKETQRKRARHRCRGKRGQPANVLGAQDLLKHEEMESARADTSPEHSMTAAPEGMETDSVPPSKAPWRSWWSAENLVFKPTLSVQTNEASAGEDSLATRTTENVVSEEAPVQKKKRTRRSRRRRRGRSGKNCNA